MPDARVTAKNSRGICKGRTAYNRGDSGTTHWKGSRRKDAHHGSDLKIPTNAKGKKKKKGKKKSKNGKKIHLVERKIADTSIGKCRQATT